MTQKITVSTIVLNRILDEAKQFSTWEGIPLCNLSIEFSDDLNHSVIIAEWEWKEGHPFKTTNW